MDYTGQTKEELMKKVVTAFLLIILFSTQYPVIFASLQDQGVELDIENRLIEIFEKRAAVWNDFLEKNFDSSEALLEEMVNYSAEPMISNDISLFNQLIENPSSYERINSLQFDKLRILRSNDNELILKGDIIWEIGDLNTNYLERASYTISLKRAKEKWMLSDYNIIN